MTRVAALGLLLAGLAAGAQQPADERDDGLALVAEQLEQALVKSDPAIYLALVAPGSDHASTRGFAEAAFVSGVTRAVVHERDRAPLAGAAPGDGYRVLFEAFIERGRAARIATWQFDLRKGVAEGGAGGWSVVGVQQISSVDGLHRLTLNPTKHFTAKNLVVTAPDLALELASGDVFVAETPDGVTALVLKGRGTMRFEPQAPAERGQVRIFAGTDTFTSPFEIAYVRINPFEFESRVTPGTLTPRTMDAGEFRRAQEFFTEQVGLTFALNLSDLSRETWSLTPPFGDFLAEVRTKRHGTLTYARSGNEPEDVTLFDRKRRKNISVYASPEKRAVLGRHYDEDLLSDYDVLNYDLDANFWPERQWVDGRTTIRLKTTRSVATLTLRLAEALTVHSIVSPDLGRLLFLRVVGQNSVIVNLPATVVDDTPLVLTIVYSGRLEPQTLEREAIALEIEQEQQDMPVIVAEPRAIYSNRSYWYPQSTVNDYATATMRVSVPLDADAVASGELRESRVVAVSTGEGSELRKLLVFNAALPLRYLSCLITRLNQVVAADVHVAAPQGRDVSAALAATRSVKPEIASVALSIKANPRQQSRGRAMLEQASSMIRFFSSLTGGAPYPSFTLALSESELPGGHSPAYFAILNQPLPLSPLAWRGDPVVFDAVPTFFLAHEIAHQWWGQSVGWKNYHEQWISEGFAQYFAALYAREERGDEVFGNVLRQMRKWAIEHADQGPVSLGYRLGHIKGEGRVFRAVIYNKGAMVLHMLRRLVGDDAFFAGLRRFYQDYCFRKASTDDFRRTMEAESGVSLERFFEQWIEGTDIPRLAFRSTVSPDGKTAMLRFEHVGRVMDVPILVTLVYESGTSDELLVRVTDRVAEVNVPLNGRVRDVIVNRDNAAVAEILR